MYKFSDIAESREGEKMNRGKGCYVNAATGIVIALLAIAISVGVGLIVHFAENRTLECNFPEVHVDGEGSVQAQVDGKQLSTAANPGAKPAAAMATSTSTMRPAATASASKHPTLLPSSGSTTTSNAPPSLKDVRLPTSLKPTHYRVKLNPDLYGNDPSKFTFEGHVEIEMNCSEPTSTVTLHINQLNVSSVRFGSTSESSAPRALSYTEDKDRQFFIIQLDKPTSRGQTYFVEMDFVGPLKDDLKGFYLSTFKKGDKTMYAATTQFEPTDARKAFPCFDEPQLKATFQVTLVRRGYLRSVSNMPRTNTVPIGNNMIEDHYETSKVMSTYLLAFIIGDFSFTAANTTNGLLYRAWSVPDSVEQTHTALDIGIRTIVNYEKYFGIGFPLPKQDMIALPDFAAGAMENWGLITYRETAMLFQPGVSSERNLQRVTTVITHELAHQWFGDLVTMQWWDDLWLNEGFATFVECMGADFLNPDWKMFEQFVVDEIHEVMDFDGLVTSHPVYVPVNNPDEINEIFDKISYSKGASIIRMMRFVLGEENFRKGINLYLTRRQYQNAFHDDLWKALSDQSITEGYPIDVKQIMDTWILQMNYPVVRITTRANKVLVQQSRFLSTPDAKDSGKYTSQFGYKWRVPITYTSSASPKFNTTKNDIYWLNETDLEINHNGAQDENWILGNIQQYGFYRVTYEDKNWMALVSQLKNKHQVIHEINRAQLINDAWSLARAGQLSTYIALQTLEYLHKELNYVPWAAAQKQLKYLESMLKKTDLYGQFESFMKTIVAEPFKHYGMDDTNSTHIETYIRSDMVKLACSYGLTECTNKARQLFNHWMDNPANNPIDPDLRDTVYCTAIAEGASEEWDFAFEQFKLATVASEKAKLMEALACSKSTWLLSRYLNIAITPTEIRKQDATKVLVYIAENSIGQALAWDFVRSKWDYLLNEYGKGVFSFTKLIAGLTASFNTEFQLTQLNDFLTKNPYMGTGTRAFQQAIEKTQTNIKWMTQNKDTVADWLKTVQTPMVKARATDVRLPQHLIPYTYDVLLKPNMYEGDPAMFTFDGYVKIYMEAKAPGSNVTVHTNKLTIDEDSIKFGREDGVTGGPVYSGERSHDDERQFEIFSLDKEISVGDKYFIEMNFTGPLTGDLAGLYLSQYQRGNTTVYIATTQMEATDARKAFPCFDEPEMKATFTVKLVRKSHMKSISNMPIIGNESVIDDFVVDIYNTSERMSTYLIAFIICDFEYTEDTTTRGIKYRAWARPESINQTYVALEAGVKIIDYYEKYFGIDYPLPKQDMIAVPDFAAGAMENWGLITYRETAMLYEAGVSSEGNLQRVNVVIAHELAHQWFGDLVTMDWWDDLWLNEGFASFVEYMGVDHLHPDWKMFEQFVLDLYGVFEIDSLVTSHPIYVPVANPEEINEIFDEISYSKGASVIRMMRFFLGEEVFQNGVQIYLKKREFANANHDDLWAGLTQAATQAGKTVDVKSIMDTWILQMNCPVIKVTKTSAGKIAVEQKRFLSNPDAVDPGKYPSPFNYTWKVPFTYATKNGRDFNQSSDNIIWLDDKQKELPDQYPKQGEWIIGNVQQFGVYRVNYDDSNWIELFKQLDSNHKVIDVINRGQIINDAFGLAKADQLSMRIALDIVGYLQDEEEYIPWEAAGKELAFIDTMLSESSLYGLFERFMRTKVEKQFERLGLNNTGAAHLTSYMRSLIAAKACAYGNDKCVTEANKLFNKYMTTKVNPIDPALKTTVYCTALRTGGEEEWEFAFDLYNTATVAAEKSRLLSALSCTRQPWLLYRLLDLTLLPDIIRKQDAYKVYISVGSNPVGILISWNFFRENWDKIFKEYGTGSFSLANIIKGVTATFNTEYLLQQMKDFKAEHPDLGTGATAFSQAEESVQANIMWMNKNYLIVKEWLERNA